MPIQKWVMAWGVAACLGLGAARDVAAIAITTAAGTEPADYEALLAEPGIDASGGFFDSNQSGTLVAANLVLGAVHPNPNLAADVDATFTASNGRTAEVVERIPFAGFGDTPGYAPDTSPIGAPDFALFLLDRPITGVTVPRRFTGDAESLVGRVAVLAGSGLTGTGDTGQQPGSRALLAGVNEIDRVGAVAVPDGTGGEVVVARFATSEFDAPDAGPGDDEPGAVFPGTDTIGEAGFTLNDSGGGLFFDFGEGYVLAWIDQTIAANPIPEPASAAALAAAGLLVGRRRR